MKDDVLYIELNKTFLEEKDILNSIFYTYMCLKTYNSGKYVMKHSIDNGLIMNSNTSEILFHYNYKINSIRYCGKNGSGINILDINYVYNNERR